MQVFGKDKKQISAKSYPENSKQQQKSGKSMNRKSSFKVLKVIISDVEENILKKGDVEMIEKNNFDDMWKGYAGIKVFKIQVNL